MKSSKRAFFALLVLLLTGCSDSLLDAPNEPSSAANVETEGKLRHPHLVGLGGSTVAGKLGDDSNVFVAFNEYEADGVSRRVLDAYAITRRILEEYGVTRRMLESYGVSRRVLEAYGVSRRVLESYGITRRVLEGYGITGEVLTKYSHTISERLLAEFGLSFEVLEAQGVSRRVLEEYAVTRRVLEKYGVSDAQWDAAVAAFERSLKLKVRIDGARPGVFLSLGALPLSTFAEEVSDDFDISFVEIDVTLSGPPVGTINRTDVGAELVPWGVSQIGSPLAEPDGLNDVHVYVLDSGVNKSDDLDLGERKDFTMLFTNRTEVNWDEDAILEMPYFDPESEGDPSDETGHGTHIAGSIGAKADGKGVVGVAPGVKIHSLKVLTAQGQTDIATVLAALDYVIAQKLEKPERPTVVNLSLGMDIETTGLNILDEGVRRATQHGIHVVVSAGNAASDARTFSPAHVEEAITVGSFGPNGQFSPFSNTGVSVDILAPGDLIASVSNDPADQDANLAILESGTSMAAAHVTGAVALLLAGNPQAQPAFARKYLMSTASAKVQAVPSGTANRALQIGPSAFQHADLPPFLQFAATAADNVDMKNMTSITSQAGGAMNASVYAGRSLVNMGGVVEGFGYYADADYSNGTFIPSYNPSGLATTLQVETLEIPDFDFSRMTERAVLAKSFGMELREVDSDLTLSGDLHLGTADAPVILYVTGKLTTTSQVTVSGFGVLLVKGEVRLNHAFSTAAGSDIAIFGDDYIWLAKGTNISAHLFAKETIWVYGNLTGSAVAHANVSLSGAGAIQYRPVSCVLTEVFWPTGLCDAAAASGSTGDIQPAPEPIIEAPAEGGEAPIADGGEAATPTADPATTTPTSDTTAPAPVSITLETVAEYQRRRHSIGLAWKGATTRQVDVYRDGARIATVANTGAWSDSTRRRGSRTYTHQVCEAGSSVCSAEITTQY